MTPADLAAAVLTSPLASTDPAAVAAHQAAYDALPSVVGGKPTDDDYAIADAVFAAVYALALDAATERVARLEAAIRTALPVVSDMTTVVRMQSSGNRVGGEAAVVLMLRDALAAAREALAGEGEG